MTIPNWILDLLQKQIVRAQRSTVELFFFRIFQVVIVGNGVMSSHLPFYITITMKIWKGKYTFGSHNTQHFFQIFAHESSDIPTDIGMI